MNRQEYLELLTLKSKVLLTESQLHRMKLLEKKRGAPSNFEIAIDRVKYQN
jgi:hypothetical protein